MEISAVGSQTYQCNLVQFLFHAATYGSWTTDVTGQLLLLQGY